MRHKEIAEALQSELASFLSPVGALPPVRVLADHFGASQKTICRALDVLVEKGLVVRIGARAGYRVSSGSSKLGGENVGTISQRARNAWQDIADELKTCMVTGSMDDKYSIPSIAEISAEYECSYRTAHKALAYLTAKGFLVRKGRRYHNAAPQSQIRQTTRNYIIIDQKYASKENVSISTILQTIDIGFRLSGRRSPEIVPVNTVTPEKMNSCGSCICISREPHNWLEDFIRTYPTPPKACIDLSQRHTNIQFRDLRKLIVVTPDNRQCGLNAANHLSNLGHERIAVFHDERISRNSWSELRLQGIGEIFPLAGEGARKAVLFEPDQAPFVSESEMKSARAAFTRVVRSVSVDLAEFLGTRLKMIDDIRHYCKRYSLLLPQFRRALEDRSITAWVGMVDEVALLGMVFLSENRIKVPSQISVLGFDNTPDAAQIGMTSYDIGFFDMAQAALHWLSTPELVHNPFSVPGALFERRTTTRPSR